MASSGRAALRLGPAEEVDGRGFTASQATAADAAILGVLQATLRRAAAGPRGAVASFGDETGRHHVVVPDWDALERVRPAALVGFFGQARDDVDHAAIIALEGDIVGRAAAFPGLLAYHNAQLASGQWGNLVVLRSPGGGTQVTGDPVHDDAVARTPAHYRSLRLHRGVLADGALGGAPPRIDETLYLDFAEAPTWRALRSYG